MRLLHTFTQLQQAETFSSFLKKEGIDNQLEAVPNKDWGSSNYGDVKYILWVIDEDQQEKAASWLEKALANPNDPVFKETKEPGTPNPLLNSFKESIPGINSELKKNAIPKLNKDSQFKNIGYVTLAILFICTLLFINSQLGEVNQEVQIRNPVFRPALIPSFEKLLYYDYPTAWMILDNLIKKYGLEKLTHPNELPTEAQFEFANYLQTPYWNGLYDKLAAYMLFPQKEFNLNVPMFERIKEGQVWRLVSPALLHTNIFHIFFNMIWLVFLGKIIEEKLGKWRYIILFLIVAIISNTAQYIMGGPNFLGISGVICGMLGFIWAREHVAPWEGYNLAPGIAPFMLVFILGMAGIQIIAFLAEVYWKVLFFPGIANTAHISGGLVGYMLGRLDIFCIRNIPTTK